MFKIDEAELEKKWPNLVNDTFETPKERADHYREQWQASEMYQALSFDHSNGKGAYV